MTQATTITRPRQFVPGGPILNRIIIVFSMVFIGVVFFISEHQWDVSTLKNYQVEAEDAAQSTQEGSPLRKISYTALGCLGLAMLMLPAPYRLRIDNSLSIVAVLFYTLCFASLLWTSEPALTLKRLGVLLFCLLAILGMARRYTARDMLNCIIGIGLCYLAIGMVAEVTQGSFRPWLPEYRFAGTVHPNSQGANLCFVCLGLFFAIRVARGPGKIGWSALFVCALGFLILTKSRTTLIAFPVALLATWFLGTTPRKQGAATTLLPFALLLILFLGLMGGADLFEKLEQGSSLGGREEAGLASLNGRVPLWIDLLHDVAQKPFLGYGYQAFWTPERIARISAEQEWTVPSAHSVFIDTLLALGIVGLVLFLLMIGISLAKCAIRYRHTQDPCVGFILATIMVGAVSAFLESGFTSPVSFDSFVTASGIAMIAFRRPETILTHVTYDSPPVPSPSALATVGEMA